MKQQIIKTFEEDKGFMGNNDFKIEKLEKDIAVLKYNIKKEGLNPLGIVHGGILFGLCDSASGALASLNGKFPLTVNASINYLNKAKGTFLIAEAKILKNGKTLGYYTVDVYDDKKTLVAVSNVTMYYTEI